MEAHFPKAPSLVAVPGQYWGGKQVVRSATRVPGGDQWVPQHTYLKMIPMKR